MTDNINPKHYRQHAHECIEFTQYLNFNLGNAFKYIWRHKEKNGREDLEKAIWYLERQRDDAPKFKKIKYRRYLKMINDLDDCGFDYVTRRWRTFYLSGCTEITMKMKTISRGQSPASDSCRTKCRLKRRAKMLSLILYIVSLIALFTSLVMALTDLSGLTNLGYVVYLPAAALIFFLGLVILVLMIMDKLDWLAVGTER